jgi:antitoxin VapB
MKTTKVFKSGNSQAVRIPKEFHLLSEDVEIFKQNGDIVIREKPKPKKLGKAFQLLTQLPEDFFGQGREDSLPQERDFL